MQHRVRSDPELLALARRGSDSAFAVLVHRHGPRVIRAASGGQDPVDHAVRVFTTAMRRLDDAPDDLTGWIDAIASEGDHPSLSDGAAAREPDGAAVSTSGDTTSINDAGHLPDDIDATIDAIWAQLTSRWPNGRRRMRVSPAVTWAITIVVTVAVSAAVPWLVLGSFPHEPDIQELRAFPIDDDPTPEPEPGEQPLPTFEFPVPPEELPVEPDDPFDESGADGDETVDDDDPEAVPDESDTEDTGDGGPDDDDEPDANGTDDEES